MGEGHLNVHRLSAHQPEKQTMTKSLFRRLSPLVPKMCAFPVLLGFAFSSPAYAVTTIGGLDFEDDAFADVLLDSGGFLLSSGADTEASLTDADPRTLTIGFGSDAFVELGFTDNVVMNQDGADLAIFELGRPSPIDVTIAGLSQVVDTVDSGFDVAFPFGSFGLNVALIDLSDFGVATNATITEVTIGFDVAGSFPPLVSLVGSLNSASVPLPPSLAFLLSGLIGLALLQYRRQHA